MDGHDPRAAHAMVANTRPVTDGLIGRTPTVRTVDVVFTFESHRRAASRAPGRGGVLAFCRETAQLRPPWT